MAVETIGVYLQQALKSGLGPAQWKQFFAVAGSAFARLEDTPPLRQHASLSKRDTFRLLKRKSRELGVIETLQAFAGVTHTIVSNKQAGTYYLIDLDIKQSATTITPFSRFEATVASEKYTELENQTRDDPSRNIVLVSAGSVSNLTKAYPSYFLDAGEFLRNLDRIFSLT